MSDREANSLGRILALVLRHAPEKFDVEMDLNGWVNSRELSEACLLYTSPSPRDGLLSRMPSSA